VSSFLLFSLGSIAQNKIAGVITDGDGQKLTTVEVYNKTTNIKVFTDAALLNLI
jgi:Fe(3+) dicitrate transport protein